MLECGVLLIELNTEELPVKNLKNLVKNFLSFFLYEFNKNFFFCSEYNYYYTLRKISCLFKNFNFYQKLNKKYNFIYGPSIDFKKEIDFSINPLCDWIKKFNIKNEEIKYFLSKNKRIFFIKRKIDVKNINFFINKIFYNVIFKLIKNYNIMRWGKKNCVFIRPITNIVVMFNKKILNVNFLGYKSNNILLGHRYLSKKNIILIHAKKYVSYLKKFGFIIIDHNDRKYKILCLLNKISFKKKISLNYTKKFLNYIVSIIEFPSCILCKFNKDFLFLPKEILISIIEKFNSFPTFNINGCLLNYFILIVNSRFNFSSYKFIKKNYENIINFKLLEVKLLFINDRKLPLIGYLPKLKNIIFYKNLGNMFDKIRRLLYLSKEVSIYLNNLSIKNYLLFYSILLSKCDLSTSLCKEYPEMKGIIGMYYSLLDYNNYNLSLIIKNHYLPRYSGDIITTNKYSSLISLIDKLDTLVGIFILCNFKINCNNDPYALRRLSISILNIIVFNNFYINLYNLIKFNIFLFNKIIKINKKKIIYIIKFVFKRSVNFFLKLGYTKKFINSVIYLKIFNFLDIKLRLESIWKVRNLKNFLLFLNLIKRIRNILLKEKYTTNNDINFINLKYDEEIDLYNYIIFLKKIKKKLFNNYKYDKLIDYFFISINKIERFFNSVRINVKNIDIKINRLNLLNKLNLFFFEFVDFNYLI